MNDQSQQRRSPLDRSRILRTALTFIDEHSLAELSMRRLGKDLDVEAMALYRYVPSRDDLLDGVVALMLDDMYDDPEILIHPEFGWQDFLQRLAHGIRRVAIAHPKAFPLVVSRPPQAPWLRPPLRSLRWVEIFLGALLDEGFEDDLAIEAYHTFTSFLLGYLLLEAAVRGAEIGASPDNRNVHLDTAIEQYPHLNRLKHGLAHDQAKEEFEIGLEDLLERIAHRHAR